MTQPVQKLQANQSLYTRLFEPQVIGKMPIGTKIIVYTVLLAYFNSIVIAL